MNYSELNLHENLQKGLAEAGYEICTPVQEQVLKTSLNSDKPDLYVQSQTGTGKTAAYLVTIMQEQLALSEEQKKSSLILVPTRELAVQVEEEASKLGKYTGLKYASFYGGVAYDKQLEKLRAGVDIIIGTPGRVIDLEQSHQMDLSNVGFLAIDEADRMFDMGFYPDLRKLIQVLPSAENRQTMLFSATLNSYVKNLAYEYTRDAVEITIESENITVDEIDQELVHVSSDNKIRLLINIISKETPESLIIFCNTKKSCEILAKRLRINGIEAEFIIGDLPQAKRLKIMDKFKAGDIKCLVATDIAARGIDVNDLAMVINYDLPNEAENYVHRIGRTARAGKSGKAFTFCSEQDVYSLVPIERYIEKQIPSRVATEEDFAEDKSKNVYIKLDSERDDFHHGSKRDMRKPRERNGRAPRFDRKHDNRRPKKSNDNFRKSSEEEIQKLASMSSDDRLAYLKAKYAKIEEKKNSAQGSKRGKGKKPQNSRSSVTKAQTTSRPSSNAQSGAKTVPQKKTGLIGKIKSLFGKK